MEENQKNTALDTDEILVKGTDGKWYLLRGEELVPYESKSEARSLPAGEAGHELGVRDLPKGVTQEAHERLEQKTVPQIRPPIVPKVASVVVSHEGHPLVKELDELVDQAAAESQKTIQAQIPPWDAVLQKRFRTLVSARLRDVRDNLETRALLTRDIKIGGLGLKEAETQILSTIIETKFKEFDQKWRAEEAKKRSDWQKKQVFETAQREKEGVQKEQEELERRHQVLIGRSGAKEKISSVVSRQTPREQVKTSNTQYPISNQILNAKKEVAESKVIKPSVIGASFESVKRSPSPVLRTPSPIGRGEGEGRPRVIDVKFTPRLLSPIEELREMNLIDFRRLGRDAAEIIFKIKAKIDLLGDESFAKKMEGVAAWKQSEPAKLYTTLSTIALTSSQSVSVIIAERDKKGEKTLTVDEFRGIMELMKGLRF